MEANYSNTFEFHYNWNNKLDCKAFTTLRLYVQSKYIVGERRFIVLNQGKKKIDKGTAIVVKIKPLFLHQINEFIARIDTGYSKEECIDIIKKMYKNKNINWEKQQLALILLVKE